MNKPTPEKQRSLDAELDFSNEQPLTQQHFKDSCDINNIMRAYTTDGLLPPGTQATALYEDFSNVDDYLSALLTIERAEQQFAMLPAKARDRFRNDPTELLTFIQDPANIAEARALGLLADEPAPTPGTPPPTPTEPPKPASDGK